MTTDLVKSIRRCAEDPMWEAHAEVSKILLNKTADRIEALEAALQRCQIVLGNMALENEGAVFNRWPINHEPLRNDARNLLPVIKAALDKDAGK